MRRIWVASLVAAAVAAFMAPVTGASASPARSAVRAQAPAPAVGPGGSVAWRPEGRQVLGRPVVYRGNSGGVELAWLDPSVLRFVFAPGTADGGGPWAWGSQIAPEVRGQLVAAFNGGFQLKDIRGGFYTEGRTVKGLVAGEASLVIYQNGKANVGEWGRDVSLTPDVVSVRQNLPLLVDAGAPVSTAGNPSAWGGSVAGIATARNGVGVDANGALVVAQARVTPQGLADALIAAGVVRGMQMDINPDWVSFALYEANADGSASGTRVMGTGGPGNLWLSPYSRDFFTVLIKPVVAPGGSGAVGNAPVTASAKVPVKK